MAEISRPAPLDGAALVERVVEIVRALAAEAGGERAARATHVGASLERELGLGSLERVELLVRLETAFARRLPEACLQLDTPQALALALAEAEAVLPEEHRRQAPALGAAAPAAAVRTLQEALWRRAQKEPRRPHAFLREEGTPSLTLTYGDLWDGAASVAGALRERGVAAGDRVALMLPTGPDFLHAFQGVVAARAVAVPIYPPARLDRLDEYARRQATILRDAGARVLITIDRARPVAALLRGEAPALEHVTSVAALTAAATSAPAPDGTGDDPALIQYTSGSTGSPKGVLLTQANLLANIAAIAAGVDVRSTDVGVSWLPLYHDMGLIGTWLFCLHHGLPLDLQSPLAFLSRPERWLWAIHERQGTLSPAPNFAYELCASRVPESALEGLDLSSWRVALNGAEPVSPDTMQRFIRRFAPYGFRPQAMMPVYGLAECSVALCFSPAEREPRITAVEREPFEREGRAVAAAADDAGALRFPSVGGPLPGHEVRIVDEQGRDAEAGLVGRLAFRGPSMTPGYFGQPEATAAVTLPGGWMDSGDLAFVMDGEVHIAGRLKDLIIKAGRNLVPQEIEELAADVPGVRRGCVAAFGVADAGSGTERLVVVAETRASEAEERERIRSGLTARLGEALGVPPDIVVLAEPGAVPKTSSGKVRRADTRRLYLAGTIGQEQRTSRLRRARIAAAAGAQEARSRAAHAGRLAYGAYVGLVVAGLFATLWPLTMLLPRRASTRVARLACRALMGLAGIRVTVDGLERLGAAGRCVLAANHASYVDVPLLLSVLPPDVLFVAKKEVRGWPLIGPFLRKAGHLTVDRWDMQRGLADADKVVRALQVASVLFFPEGTFTPQAGLRPFRLGAFQSAAETGLPVVPLALRGTRRILRDGFWRPRPGRVQVWLGDPIAPTGTGWTDVVALREKVADALAAHCGEPRLDLVAAGPVRS